MMFLLLSSLVLLFTVVSADCRANAPDMTCTIKTVFLLDDSAYMGNPVNGDAVIDFAHDKVLPRYRLSEPNGQTAFMSFGAGYSNNPLTSNYTNACFYLELLKKQNENANQNVPLLAGLQQFSSNYQADINNGGLTLTIFTRANSTTDIQNSANFINTNLTNVRVITVLLFNDNQIPAAWSDFSNADQFNIDVTDLYDSSLADCLIKRLCQDYSDCGMWDRAFSTIAPTAPVVTATPEQPKNLNGPSCNCRINSSYNDIMVLMDTSKGMSIGLDSAVAAAATALDDLNIQFASDGNIESSTRLGLITFASSAKLEYPLGTLNNAGLGSLFGLASSDSDELTNLSEALNMAIHELNGTNHRNTSRPMIMIFSSVYNSDDQDDPAKISFTFQDNMHGIVFVWNFVQNDEPSDKLKEVASPGYFMTNDDQHDGDIQQAICDANCYCAHLLTQFGPGTNPRGLPSAGCYYFSKAQANRKFSEMNCQNFKANANGTLLLNGTLATDRTAEKTAFLIGIAKDPKITQTQQVIGLSYNPIYDQYYWDDGQVLDCSSYCPWCNNVKPDPSVGHSVFMYPGAGSSTTGCWQATADNKGAIYTCEYPPCDSTFFCGSDEY